MSVLLDVGSGELTYTTQPPQTWQHRGCPRMKANLQKLSIRPVLVVGVLIIAGLLVSACSVRADRPKKIEPAHVEKVEGTELNRLTLTARAAERIGIQTATVRDAPPSARRAASGNEMQRKVVPYAAVIYGLNGETWVYISPEPLLFVRQPVSVDYIEGDTVVLSDGPPLGTVVVTAGAAELFGIEFGVGT